MHDLNCNEIEWLCSRITSLQDELTHHIDRLFKSNQPGAVKAYCSFFSEKTSLTPEQTISDCCERLLSLANSKNILADLSEYVHIQELLESAHRNASSSCDLNELTSRRELLISKLLTYGITENWLLLHGLASHTSNNDQQSTCDTDLITYTKIKGGVRIDGAQVSGDVVLPNFINDQPVLRIGEGAFSRKKNISSIVLPRYLLGIERNAFSYTNITQITIPNSVDTIGEKAFYSCKQLQHITLSESVRHIKARAFFGCELLTTISIPHGVTYIGDEAFENCRKLKSIKIPSSVSRLGSGIVPPKTIIYCESGSRASRYVAESYKQKQKPLDAYAQDHLTTTPPV